MVKFDKQSLCQKKIYLHDTSSCSLYLYCMCKASVTEALVQVDSLTYALSKHKHNVIYRKNG